MLDRLIASVMLWSLGGCVAWFIGHEYTAMFSDKFDAVSRALGGL